MNLAKAQCRSSSEIGAVGLKAEFASVPTRLIQDKLYCVLTILIRRSNRHDVIQFHGDWRLFVVCPRQSREKVIQKSRVS